MENKEYFARVSELFVRVEEKLDEFEDEIDYDPTPDKLMVTFENNSEKNCDQYPACNQGNLAGREFKRLAFSVSARKKYLVC